MAAETTTKQSPTPEVDKPAQSKGEVKPSIVTGDVAPLLNEASPLQPSLVASLAQLDVQRQQQQISAAMWSGVIHALIHVVPTPAHDARRHIEELEQHLALLLEEKKKQRKSFDGRDSVFFERLVAVLGQKSAESVVATIDKAISENGAALQNNPAAVGKIVAELAKLLSNGDTLMKLGISPQAVEKSLQEAFLLKLQPANKVDFAAVTPVLFRATGPIEQPISIGKDLVASAKNNPEGVAAFLCNADGVVLLRNRLESQPSSKERIALLASLKDVVGQERFSQIITSYDTRLRLPIASDLIRLHEGNQDAQAETVRLCFGPESKIFTPQERERFISFMKQEQASIIEVLARENERVVHSISTIEANRVAKLKHLADELKVESIKNVPDEKVREEVLRAIAQRFPALSGKSEVEVLEAIRGLGGKEKHDRAGFQAELLKLGVTPSAPDAHNSDTKQMKDIKELATRVESRLSDIIEYDKDLTRLRAIQTTGQHDEAAQVSASYDKLLGGLFPEYGAERFKNTRAKTKLYLDTLAARIKDSNQSERAALVVERDSLEWRALQERTRIHLSKTPPEIQRSIALVQEYLLPHDGISRSAACNKAAQGIVQALQGVFEYTEEQRNVLARGHEAKAKQLAELEEQVERCNDDLTKKRESQGSDHWNHIYSEIGKFNAWKQIGHTQVTYDDGKSWTPIDQAINAHWKEINGKWTRANMGSELHQGRMIQLAQELALKEHARDQAAAQKKELEECVQKKLLDSQQSLIRQIVNSGRPVEGAIDVASFKATVSRCDVQNPTDGVDAKYKTLLASRESVQRSFTEPAMRARSALFERAERREVSSALSEQAQSATQSKTQAELVARLSAILSNDPSARPSKEAVDALKAALDKDSSLAKQLELVSNAPSTEILMQRLYARLSMDDAARVRLFLLTYKRPSLFEPFFEGTEHTTPSNAAEVWKHLQTCKPEDLDPFLMLIPSLQKHAEVEELAAKLPEADLASVKGEFKRITGRSLGDSLISLLPAEGGARQRYLYELIAGSRCVDSADLARFFPQGVVPQGIKERQEKLGLLLDEDKKSALTGLLKGLSGGAHESGSEASQKLKALLDSQAEERATLQASLPVFVQLNRFDRVEEIRKRLEELDQKFAGEIKQILGAHEASAITRFGVEEHLHRMQAVLASFKAAQVSDPAGPVARKAFEVMKLLEDPKVPVSAALQELRRAEFTPGQMLVFETIYAQHVMRRAPAGLSGDVAKDLSAKEGAPKREHLAHLLRGGDGLTEYDLVQLTEGIRTRNPLLTVRAMIAIEAKRHLPEAIEAAIKGGRFTAQQWEEFKKSEVGKGAAEYYDAAIHSDTARTTAIMVRDGLDAGVHGISWTVGKIGSLTGEQLAKADKYYYEKYGTHIASDLKKHMPTIDGAWENVVSSDPQQRATGVMQVAIGGPEEAAAKGTDLRLVRQALDLCSTPEQRRELIKNLDTWVQGLPNSVKYVDGRPLSVIEYVRLYGGPFGESDALFLKQTLSADDPRGLTGAKLDQYIMLREQLLFQLRQADRLHASRNEIHQQAINFSTTVGNAWSSAIRDRDNRTLSYNRANELVQVHDRMRADQSDLLRQHRAGFSDIRGTKELMRVRGELILEDLVKNQDRGLSVEQGERNFRELRERDAKREWVVARRDKVEAWVRDAEIAQKRLENFDWWTNVIYTGVKTVAIIAACVVFTPAGAFAFATAWNLGEKAFKVAFNGMSLQEASREFLIDLAIDVAFVGVLGCLKFGRGLAKSADGSIKASKWGFFWQGPFTKLSSFRGVGHSTHVAAQETIEQASRGTVKSWVKADAGRLIEGAAKKFIGKLGEGVEKWFEHSVKAIGANGAGAPAGEQLKRKMHEETEPKQKFDAPKATDLVLEPTRPQSQSKKVDPEGPTKSEPRSAVSTAADPKQHEPPATRTEKPVEKEAEKPVEKAAQEPTVAPVGKVNESSKKPVASNPTPVELLKLWSDAKDFNLDDFLSDFKIFALDALNVGWGLFDSSKTSPPPPPPVTGSPPSAPPTTPPPPKGPPGDGGAPSSGPVLAQDSPTGNAYTRAQGQPQSQPSSVAQTQQDAQASAAPVSQAQATSSAQADSLRVATFNMNAIAAANEVANRNIDAVSNAHVMTQVEQQATMNGLYNANAVQQAATDSLRQRQAQIDQEAQIVANRALVEAATAASHQAARSESLAAANESALAASQAERRVAEERRTNSAQEEPIILVRRHLNERSEALAQGEVGQAIETKAAVSAARESSVPLMRDAVTTEKDAELISKTTHLKAQEERNISEAKREEVAYEDARQEQIQASVSVRQVRESLQQEQAQVAKHGEQPMEERARWYAASPAGSAPLAQPPIIRKEAITEDLESQEADEESTQHKRNNKARKQKLDAARALRERQIIIHQLMTRSFEQSKREKLLRMLIALGISEKEYRELVAQLGQAEVEAQASQNQHAQKIAVEPLETAPAQPSVPTMKSSAPRQDPSIVVKHQPRSRAELYAKLRKQQGETVS